MNPEDLLSDALHDRVERTDYPSTPLSTVAGRAGAIRARRRRTTFLAARRRRRGGHGAGRRLARTFPGVLAHTHRAPLPPGRRARPPCRPRYRRHWP